MPMYRVRHGQSLGINDGVTPKTLIGGDLIELSERIAAEVGGRIECIDDAPAAPPAVDDATLYRVRDGHTLGHNDGTTPRTLVSGDIVGLSAHVAAEIGDRVLPVVADATAVDAPAADDIVGDDTPQ